MKSKEFRNDPRLLRNEYPVAGAFQMPIIQAAKLPEIQGMLSYHDTRMNDQKAKEVAYLVHFFKNDVHFEFLYEKKNGEKEKKRLVKLAQYAAVCTPDFSLYPEMALPVQMMQVFKSRWCGAYWQSMGLCVIPTVTWADEDSYSFCFDGITKHSSVAVSTVGCKKSKPSFLKGYDKMLEVIEPEMVICYGTPFDEMAGNIVCYPYEAFRRRVS